MRFLWRFFRRRFFLLWVAIFLRFRFLPEPFQAPLWIVGIPQEPVPVACGHDRVGGLRFVLLPGDPAPAAAPANSAGQSRPVARALVSRQRPALRQLGQLSTVTSVYEPVA